MKKIADYNCCPHCGSDYGYYQKIKCTGKYNLLKCFTGEIADNAQYVDSLIQTPGKWYYCEECHKKICKAGNENE